MRGDVATSLETGWMATGLGPGTLMALRWSSETAMCPTPDPFIPAGRRRLRSPFERTGAAWRVESRWPGLFVSALDPDEEP